MEDFIFHLRLSNYFQVSLSNYLPEFLTDYGARVELCGLRLLQCFIHFPLQYNQILTCTGLYGVRSLC